MKQSVTRNEHLKMKKKQSIVHKLDRYLNILIVLVALLIIAVLVRIVAMPVEENLDEQLLEQSEEAAEIVGEEQSQPSEQNQQLEEPVVNDTEITDQTVIEIVDDPIVKEVHTNEAWNVIQTEQTGTHTSVYEKGHIDYEEKLQAIFSVLPELQMDNSIVLSVQNNGDAQKSIAVVTSMDKVQMFRVSIEWVDSEGWKPVKKEVLSTVNGAY